MKKQKEEDGSKLSVAYGQILLLYVADAAHGKPSIER